MFSYYAISGNRRILFPLASKMALPMAGAMPTMRVSPRRRDDVLAVQHTLSITGVSAKRGTGVFANGTVG